MRSLFSQAETIDSTALALPLCTLFLMGDFAVDRDGRFLTSMRRKGMRARQTEAIRWIMSVLPYGANIYSYRVGKKELWTMNWRKVWGSISVPFLPTAHWLWFVLNCFTITERSMRHSVFKIRWNNQVGIFAVREWGIGNYVNRADRKLWDDTCYKINQIFYAYHSFQSWQVTPPARIREYIYNSTA